MARMRWLSPLLVVCLGGGALAACGSDDDSSSTSSKADAGGVTVTMQDYNFAVSGKLTAGEPITAKNAGDELHMMGLGKLKPGVTLDQVRTALSKADPNAEGDPTADLIEHDPELGWPGGFVSPGHSVQLSAAGLTPGEYAMICFIPAEGTGEPHFTKGMINQLDVVPARRRSSPSPTPPMSSPLVSRS